MMFRFHHGVSLPFERYPTFCILNTVKPGESRVPSVNIKTILPGPFRKISIQDCLELYKSGLEDLLLDSLGGGLFIRGTVGMENEGHSHSTIKGHDYTITAVLRTS